jgi:hypothetical protein
MNAQRLVILTISEDGQFIFQCEWLVINTSDKCYSHGIDIHCTNNRTTPRPNFSIDRELKANEKTTLVISLYAVPSLLLSWVVRSFRNIEEETRTGSDWPPLRSSNELQNDNVFSANLTLESNACLRANFWFFLRTSCRAFSLWISASCFLCSW